MQKDWLGPWAGLAHCSQCHGLITELSCPLCGHAQPPAYFSREVIDGEEHRMPTYVTQGALSWTAHSLLGLMKREWERPIAPESATSASLANKASQNIIVVILFWTLFEHIMEQFFRTAIGGLPNGVGADLMKRYQTIGSRMDRLYKILFNRRMAEDLDALGHETVYTHLQEIKNRRNEFIHGNAEAIDDALVRETVDRLHEVQAAWLALYNHHCTGNPSAPPVWQDRK